jgi:signal transduction histidine kinase
MTMRRGERLRRGIAAAGVVGVLVSVAYLVAGRAPLAEIVSVVGVAVAFIGAGLIAWARRPDLPIGRVMVAAGVCELLTPLVGPPLLVLAPLGHVAGACLTVLVGYLLLTFPSGRLPSRTTRWSIVLAGLLILAVRLAVLVSLDPATRGWTGSNPYRLITDPGIASALEQIRLVVLITVVALFVFLCLQRWFHATGPGRRPFTPVVVAGLGTAAVYFVGSIVSLGSPSRELKTTLLWSMDLAVALFAIGFLAGLLRIHLVRSAVADLVVELGDTPTPARLRDALANALGDPSLLVAYWSPPHRYLTSDGQEMRLPAEGSDRAVTRLEREGTPIAAIIHDPALLDDPGLVASVASALRLAVENERLGAEVEAQLAEVRASRARIVEAGDAERGRLERDLHDGAQQRLVALAMALRMARLKVGDDADPALRESLAQASDEARMALAELRELARGIHPAILTEAGLGPAVESLADRSVVPAAVVGVTSERFSPTVERTGYYFVSEALTNANKHSGASHIRVVLEHRGAHLCIEVSDDGIGGASADQGTGLRGLRDRLAAVDGTLTIDSPVGAGTRLVATIPVDPAPPGA